MGQSACKAADKSSHASARSVPVNQNIQRLTAVCSQPDALKVLLTQPPASNDEAWQQLIASVADAKEMAAIVKILHSAEYPSSFVQSGSGYQAMWPSAEVSKEDCAKTLQALPGINLARLLRNSAPIVDCPPATERSEILTDDDMFLLSRGSVQAAAAVQNALEERSVGTVFPQLLYSLYKQGESWGRCVTAIDAYGGPVMIVVRLKQTTNLATPPPIVGAFVNCGLRENATKFYGDRDTFLFSLSKTELIVKPASGSEPNFVLFNRAAQFVPKGLGFGGDDQQPRLLISSDLHTLTATVACRTFQSGSLFGKEDTDFVKEAQIENIEIWGFGGAAAAKEQMYKHNLSEDLKAERRKVDVARMMGGDEAGFFKKKANAGERTGEVEAIIAEHKEEQEAKQRRQGYRD